MFKRKWYYLDKTDPALFPRPTLRARARCWFRDHDLRIYTSAVRNFKCWHCKVCGRFMSKAGGKETPTSSLLYKEKK